MISVACGYSLVVWLRANAILNCEKSFPVGGMPDDDVKDSVSGRLEHIPENHGISMSTPMVTEIQPRSRHPRGIRRIRLRMHLFLIHTSQGAIFGRLVV